MTLTMTATMIEATLQSEHWIYLCVGPNIWGKGFTPDQAQTAAGVKARTPAMLFACSDPWAYVDGMGSICYTPTHPRVEGAPLPPPTYVQVAAQRLPAKR